LIRQTLLKEVSKFFPKLEYGRFDKELLYDINTIDKEKSRILKWLK